MKRNEIVEALINEGFSEKTLVKFSDKQLSDLHERIIGEADVMISKKDPLVGKKVDDAKKENKSIEVYEKDDVDEELKGGQKKLDKNKNGKIDAQDFKLLKGEKKEVKEWLETVAESKFHSFTSKNEIMELVKTKLNEVEVGPNVNRGHNGIPEFMSYDAISSVEVDESSPTTKPAPTKPKVDPGTKPRTPYSPKPGEKSKPKALKEKNNANK